MTAKLDFVSPRLAPSRPAPFDRSRGARQNGMVRLPVEAVVVEMRPSVSAPEQTYPSLSWHPDKLTLDFSTFPTTTPAAIF